MANDPAEGKRTITYGPKVVMSRASTEAHDKVGRVKVYANRRISFSDLSRGHPQVEGIVKELERPRAFLVVRGLVTHRSEDDDDGENIGIAWSAAARAFEDVTERFQESEAVLAELERAAEGVSR